MTSWRVLSLVVLSLALGSCTVPQAERPAPPALPAATPPPPPPPAADWTAWSVAAGDWSYAADANGTVARFRGPDGAQIAALRCDRAARTVTLARAGQASGADGSAMMTIRTSFGAFQWPARSVGGSWPATAATRAASDGGLDWIAFSRGRFAVELPGLTAVVLPGWAEPARVIEDCRG